MLMHIISVEPRPTMKVNIHNQCSNLKLTSSGYFKNSINWDKHSAQEVDSESMKSIYFKSSLKNFEDALIYELQKEYNNTNNQHELVYTLLLVAWKYEGYKKFCALVQLIECDKAFRWYEVGLEEYYQRYANQLSAFTGPIKGTWLIHDGTVLMTELELHSMQRDGRLDITISEGIRNDHVTRPIWISLER
jgi:hypothetical protein